MSQSIPVLTLSIEATASVSAHHFVTAAGVHALNTENVLGVSRSDGVSGQVMPVDVLGTTVVQVSAPVSKGDYLQVSTSPGQAAPLAAGPAVAMALQEATAIGQLIEVLLIPNTP